MIDLSALDTRAGGEAGYELELLHPATREPLGMFVTVRGEDSDTYQEQLRTLQQQRIKAKGPRTVEQIQDEAIDLLAAATVSWRGVMLDGAELPCTPENVRKVYRRFQWLREQVDAATGDRANFLPGCVRA